MKVPYIATIGSKHESALHRFCGKMHWVSCSSMEREKNPLDFHLIQDLKRIEPSRKVHYT